MTMEPEEWERLADAFAEQTQADLSRVEEKYWPNPPGGSFRDFWAQVKRLSESVRTATAIKLDDKLALQRRINELCQKARKDQKKLQEEKLACEREILDTLSLAAQNLAEATTAEEVQEVRADLAAIRERVVTASRQYPGRRNQGIWEAWQDTNQTAWVRLNELWASNEQELASLMESAEHHLTRGDVRAAKESIKQFHADAATKECSHRALRALRVRAGGTWQRANEVGRDKHQRYLEQAEKRVAQWRAARDRQARARDELEREVVQLERQAGMAPTDVGAALIRGQLEERRRALSRLDAEARELDRRIEAMEMEQSTSR